MRKTKPVDSLYLGRKLHWKTIRQLIFRIKYSYSRGGKQLIPSQIFINDE